MPLTPKGMDLMKDAFNDVNVREYKLNMQQNTCSQTYNIQKKVTCGVVATLSE